MSDSQGLSAVGEGIRHRIADHWVLLLLAATPVLFVLTTWDPTQRHTGLATARGYSLPVVLVETIVLLHAMTRGFSLAGALARLSGQQRWFLGVVAAVAIGTAALGTIDPGTAIARTCINALHVAFGFAMAFLFARWSVAGRHMFWPAIAIGGCGFVVLLPVFLASVPDPATFDWLHFRYGVGHVRQLGFYAGVLAAVALGLAATAATRRGWGLWTAVATLGFGLSCWSGTRGSIVAVFGALVLGAVIIPSLRRLRTIAAAAISFATGAILSLPLMPASPLFGIWRMTASLQGDDVSSGRLAMWHGTWRGIGDRWLFGHGESQFRLLVPDAVGEYNHPHNVLLQLGFQWGLVGTVCVLALMVPLARKMVAGVHHAPDPAAPACLVVLMLAIFSLYEGTAYHTYPLMMAALGVAYLVTLPATESCTDRHPRSRAPWPTSRPRAAIRG